MKIFTTKKKSTQINKSKLLSILHNDKMFFNLINNQINKNYSIYKLYNILKDEFNYNEVYFIFNYIKKNC